MSATVRADRVVGPSLDIEALLLSRHLARRLLVALAGLASLVVFAAFALSVYGSTSPGVIQRGVSAGGIAIGGMDAGSARALVASEWVAYASLPLTLQGPDSQFDVTPAELGFAVDADATIDRALAVGRRGSLWRNSQDWARGASRGIEVPLALDLNPDVAASTLARLAPEIVSAPADAKLTFPGDGRVDISPDQPGLAIDARATLVELASAASSMDSRAIAVAVQVLPASIKGSDLEAARASAEQAIAAPIVLRAGEQTWHLDGPEIAQLLRPAAGGSLGIDRSAVAAMIRSLAASIDQPLADATVVVGNDGRLKAIPGGSGFVIDVNASADAITRAILGGAPEADLAYAAASPSIPNAIAEAAAQRGNALLDAGLPLQWEGGGAALDREDLLRALVISVDPAQADPFRFSLDEQAVREVLAGIAGEIDQPVRDARFRIVDGEVTVAVPDRVGRVLDVDAGARKVVAGFGSGQPVTIDVAIDRPRWSAADLATINLGGDVLGEGGTYYGESSEPRRQNIELAAFKESGWLVPPGEEFSYAENIGNVDIDNGFVTGFGITEQDGQFITSPVVGGGICQVSTTIFQAAFWSGLPITERYQHPYFLQAYSGPPTGLPGLDAMVNIDPNWTLDMKFRNTTGNWIAVIVVADGQNIWSKIIGVDPGWNVEVTDPVITNRITPDAEMVYVDSPELPEGQEMVIERAADGFDVSLSRAVYDGDGNLIDAVTLESKFSPSLNRTLLGTGGSEG